MLDVPSAGFDGEELRTWTALATVVQRLPGSLDAGLRKHRLTHFEYGVLHALMGSPDHALRMNGLAQLSNSSPSRLTRALTRLESRGWADRVTDPVDGRFTLARLTDLGRTAYAQATPDHEATVRHLVLEQLDHGEREQLRMMCRRIAARITDT